MPFKGGGPSTDAKRGGRGGFADQRGVLRGGLRVGQHSARTVGRGSASDVGGSRGGFKFWESSSKNKRE